MGLIGGELTPYCLPFNTVLTLIERCQCLGNHKKAKSVIPDAITIFCNINIDCYSNNCLTKGMDLYSIFCSGSNFQNSQERGL